MKFAQISVFQLALSALWAANKLTMDFLRSLSKCTLKCMLKNAWKHLKGIACTLTSPMTHVNRQKRVSSLSKIMCKLNWVLFWVLIRLLLTFVTAVEDKFCVKLTEGTERCTTSKKKIATAVQSSLIFIYYFTRIRPREPSKSYRKWWKLAIQSIISTSHRSD